MEEDDELINIFYDGGGSEGVTDGEREGEGGSGRVRGGEM